MIVDCHCHLDHPDLSKDIDNVIARAHAAGVKAIITNGVNPETNRLALEFSSRFEMVRPALGIYPVRQLQREISDGGYALQENLFDFSAELDFIRQQEIAAVGEVGLDFSTKPDEDEIKEQKEHFLQLIRLAEDLNRPIIVHSRKAESLAIEMLEGSKNRNIILHCFSGKLKLVKRAADHGWHFTIPTNVVRAEHFQKMVEMIDISQLLCETDAPYLSPYPGERNEPANVIESYKMIAKIKGLELEEVKRIIFMNYQKVFS